MSGWPKGRLGDCCEIVSGATPRTSEASYWGGQICWATPKDLADLDGAYIADTPRKITPAGLQSCAATVLPVDSVLFSSRAPIGHVAVNTVPMATNQGFKSFIPRRDRVDSKFLFHWLRRNRMYLQSLGNGATFKEVSKSLVARIEVPLPPVAEQRRIAKLLDRVEYLQSRRRETIAQLEGLTEAIFAAQFGDPILNPRGLRVHPLRALVDPDRPISYGILKPGPHQEDGVKYVRVVDLQNGGINGTSVRRTTAAISHAYRRSLLEAGDVLLSIRGHVGRLALVPAELEGANITQDTARIAVKGVSNVFVRECLRTRSFQRWMARHTKGVAVRGINLGDVKLMPIIVPPAAEQRDFARRMTANDKLKAAHRASLSELDTLFASLQHRAFRGEL